VFDDNAIEIPVRDWGCGSEDVARARSPMFTTGGDDRSGMGFTIMESFMDTLRVRSKPQSGTTVTMRRKISVRVSRR
jgi:stage II sporulation protein AB (anti-sigma F factor)